MPLFLKEVQAAGFSGVQNFPTVGLIDGTFRRNLEETGMGFGLEVDMIRTASEMNLLTTPYAFDPDEAAAMAALKGGRTDALFGDGVALARWVGGPASGGCCRLIGGPYLESRFFGEGMVIAVPLADIRLRAALDYALSDLEAKGTMAELYQRWFPIGLFDHAAAPPVDASKRAP
jgi:ABC-type amino acid transport substrate-binding protein